MDERNKNFGLSLDEFNNLLEALGRGDDQMFKTIFFAHFDDCISYVQRNYGANYDDAYDATMEATLDLRLRLLDGKITYGNLRFLLTKMATQFYVRMKKEFQSTTIEESDIKEVDQINEEDVLKLEKAWSRLGEDCQSLLSMNFYSNMKLSAIAEDTGKPATAVRKQKERCLKKLMEYFKVESIK